MKLRQLLSERKDTFLKYIKESPLSKELKAPLLQFLISKEHNDDIYYCYPEIFAPVFYQPHQPDPEAIRKINLAAYFMYASLNLKDCLLDNKMTPQDAKQTLLLSFATQEESIKLLGNLFDVSSEFWIFWNLRRSEYLSALRIKWNEAISWEAYEELSEAKSAFAKVSIDIWKIWLSNPEKDEIYHKLLESHRLFTVGFQILDDVLDFEQDFEDKHYNIAYMELASVLAEKGISCTDIGIMQKYLYIEGVAEMLLRKAIGYFDKSLEVLEDDADHIPIWKQVIHLNKRQVQFFLLQIDTYFKRLYARKTLSTTPLVGTENYPVNAMHLDIHIKKAAEFIQSQQNSDGYWEDFYNNAGTSDVWTTAFILLNIQGIAHFPEEPIDKAIQFLLNSRHQEGWGYTTQAPLVDTDSTTCVLYSLYKRNNCQIDKPYTAWLHAQTQTGGFTTFKNEDDLNEFLVNSVDSVSSWMQSHTCVSALAYFFLSQYGNRDDTFKRLETYIQNEQTLSGEWDSYWWTSPAYSTCYAAMGMVHSDYNRFTGQIDKAITALLNKYYQNGYLLDDFNKKGSVFYTSLFLRLLMAHPAISAKYTVVIETIVNWLLQQQFSDGSFPPSASMRVPSSSYNDISKITNWETKAKYNNMVSEDFARLFSTAAAINALHNYYNQN